MGIQEYLCDLSNNQLREIKYRFRDQMGSGRFSKSGFVCDR